MTQKTKTLSTNHRKGHDLVSRLKGTSAKVLRVENFDVGLVDTRNRILYALNDGEIRSIFAFGDTYTKRQITKMMENYNSEIGQLKDAGYSVRRATRVPFYHPRAAVD